MGKITQLVTALNAVTATTTSQVINIEGASKVVLFYKRADHSAGKTVFSADVSVDGSNFVTYNKWISNAANTNAQTLTRVASVDTGTANATGFITMSPEDGFREIKVTATETTDGTHSAWVYIEY
jgi:hypothetical protein